MPVLAEASLDLNLLTHYNARLLSISVIARSERSKRRGNLLVNREMSLCLKISRID